MIIYYLQIPRGRGWQKLAEFTNWKSVQDFIANHILKFKFRVVDHTGGLHFQFHNDPEV